MSSRPHNTHGTEKPSTPEQPAAAEASGFNYCPHCGGELDGQRLAEHMGRNACGEHDEPESPDPPRPHQQVPEVPTLDNHDEREHGGADLEERRALADELEAAGVWVADAGSGD